MVSKTLRKTLIVLCTLMTACAKTPLSALPTSVANTIVPSVTTIPNGATPTPEATSTPSISVVITSLEGNSEVLDSDSLIANVSGLEGNKSKLTYKWFRNGIILKEAQNAVLSNLQMKSFYGNPAEYTPASSHADHAITGYKFSVFVFDEVGKKIGNDTVTIQGPTVDLEMKGINIVTWENWQTIDGKAKASIIDMQKRLNPNWVSIWTLHYQDGINSSIIYAKPTGDPSTINDIYTIEQIKIAHGLGLKVILYPQVWLYINGKGTPANREHIVPTTKWFKSYKEMIIQQANIAEANNVEMFVVGVELLDTEKETSQWLDLISEVRQHYHGLIAYDAIAAGDWALNDVMKVSWLSELDYIGLSCIFEFPTAGYDPTLSETVKYYEQLSDKMKKVSEHFGKPIICLEAGPASVDGAIGGLQLWREDIADFQEEADYYEALFRVFGNKPWLKGVFWNQWLVSQETWYKEDSWWAYSTGFLNKPAELVLSSWYR